MQQRPSNPFCLLVHVVVFCPLGRTQVRVNKAASYSLAFLPSQRHHALNLIAGVSRFCRRRFQSQDCALAVPLAASSPIRLPGFCNQKFREGS